MGGFKKKTLKEIHADIINEYTTRLRRLNNKNSPLLPKAAVHSFAWAVAGVSVMKWNFLSWVYLQILPQYCGPEMLKLWGSLLGQEYKTGVSTTLQIEIQNVTASNIIAGTLWKSLKNGVVYKSLSTVTPVDSTATLNVLALTSGPSGNLNIDDILEITNPFDGIPDKATVKSVVVTGSNDEDIEVYRKRVLLRFKQKPQGGSAIDYFLWGTEVPGINDVLPYVFESGTIVLYLVSEGSGYNRTPSGKVVSNPFPTWINGNMQPLSGSGLFFQVANAINSSDGMKNDRRPAGAVVELREPNYTDYKIEITGLSAATNDVIAKVKNAIISYFDSKRPELPALGYSKQNATINSSKLSSVVQNIIDLENGSMETFVLKNSENEIITEDILGLGCLACLKNLIINNVEVVL